MANANLTADVIVKEGLAIFKNNTPFLQGINRQYDKQYEVAGAQAGSMGQLLVLAKVHQTSRAMEQVKVRRSPRTRVVTARACGLRPASRRTNPPSDR